MGSEGALPGVIYRQDAGPATHQLADLADAGPGWPGSFLACPPAGDGGGS